MTASDFVCISQPFSELISSCLSVFHSTQTHLPQTHTYICSNKCTHIHTHTLLYRFLKCDLQWVCWVCPWRATSTTWLSASSRTTWCVWVQEWERAKAWGEHLGGAVCLYVCVCVCMRYIVFLVCSVCAGVCVRVRVWVCVSMGAAITQFIRQRMTLSCVWRWLKHSVTL